MKKKKQDFSVLALKAARKESREEEFRLHGKPINRHKVVPSKKLYNRKRNKADRTDDLPCFIIKTKQF